VIHQTCLCCATRLTRAVELERVKAEQRKRQREAECGVALMYLARGTSRELRVKLVPRRENERANGCDVKRLTAFTSLFQVRALAGISEVGGGSTEARLMYLQHLSPMKSSGRITESRKSSGRER
jgi:hypothetical protein